MIKMTDSQRLLADYVNTGSEAAFRDLVTRYTDLVYSTAVRLVDGDTQLAQDVAQTVFIDLARIGRTFSGEIMLGGWLHRHTRFVAATIMRGERRRKSRERHAAEMNEPQNEPPLDLKQVSETIDEAIDSLAKEDRAAIILRFFEQADLRSVGAALGIGENAARMRVNRALEKLHSLLKRRGATLSATALAAALGAEAVTAAPAGLSANLAAVALSAGAAGSGLTLTLFKTVAMTKLKVGLAAAVAVAGLSIPLLKQHQALAKLRQENSALRLQADGLGRLAAENARLSNLLAQPTQPDAQSQTRELLKLRGEIGQLKRQLAEAPKTKPTTATVAASRDPMEVQKEIGIANMVYSKGWMLAFRLYADQNQGQFPTNFESAASFLPEEIKNQTNYTTDQFEILYQGSVDAITNPASIIIIREKEPWQAYDGGWVRGYAFADGHSEIHRATDGNFEPWESVHLWSPPSTGRNQ
jgi:RNA polymerase sigma factor (sigma-70 family)